MADVLLGQAYYLRFDPKLFQAQQPYAPLGTLYAAAYLRERGHSPALFDAMLAESVGEWGSALEQQRPRIAAIYEDSFNYLSKMCLLRMRDAALAMIDQAVRAKVPILISGSDATDRSRPRLTASACLGSRRCAALPGHLDGPARSLLDEHRDDQRLSVPLQLVRETDLRPAIHRSRRRGRGR